MRKTGKSKRKRSSVVNTVVSNKGWEPPVNFIPELDKFITHNSDPSNKHIGSIQIAAWLNRNKIRADKDSVYRWLKKRSAVLNAK